MKELNFDAPINSLSLGNVSVNFLRELYKKEIDVNLYPVSSIDLSAFNELTDEFLSWLNKSSQKPLKKYKADTPTLKVWHINGSEKMLGTNQFLYTFFELNQATEQEINIVKAQKHVFFSSSEAANIFREAGCKNVSYVPLGFDNDFGKTNKEYLGEDTIHFGLIGKFEKRKNTAKIINSWLECFGNNTKYQLTCLVFNPFYAKEQMEKDIHECTENKNWNNINFLPKLKTNSEVNDLMNSIDIDLSGLSNGEGWNLPSFNATALGKWSIVSDCSSHKDWATKDNCILISPKGTQECYDNRFFIKGGQFNQGEYYDITRGQILEAIKDSVRFAKKQNKHGLDLQKKFTYSNSIDQILKKMDEVLNNDK